VREALKPKAGKRRLRSYTLALKWGPDLGLFLMSVQELESAVTRLSPSDLATFIQWFEEFVAETWDKRLEADVRNGKLDHLAKQADEHFEAGRCQPL
jgi:hypothetical protein